MGELNEPAPDGCPVCDSEAVETAVYGLHGICVECGFVLQADRDAIPEWAIPDVDSDSPNRDDWETFCRVQNATEQQLAEAFGEIESVAARFELPTEIRKKTASIYGRAFRAEVTDGRETVSMVAACLRFASLQVTKPIPTGRLTDLETVDSSLFRQSCSVLQSAVDITAPPVEPVSYLWFIQQVLTVDSQTVSATEELLQSVTNLETLVGKDPAGVAAGGLYCNSESLTQQTVADAVGVSTETIRLRAADLQEAATG
jgi:transcription initiation factor TFIIB